MTGNPTPRSGQPAARWPSSRRPSVCGMPAVPREGLRLGRAVVAGPSAAVAPSAVSRNLPVMPQSTGREHRRESSGNRNAVETVVTIHRVPLARQLTSQPSEAPRFRRGLGRHVSARPPGRWKSPAATRGQLFPHGVFMGRFALRFSEGSPPARWASAGRDSGPAIAMARRSIGAGMCAEIDAPSKIRQIR